MPDSSTPQTFEEAAEADVQNDEGTELNVNEGDYDYEIDEDAPPSDADRAQPSGEQEPSADADSGDGSEPAPQADYLVGRAQQFGLSADEAQALKASGHLESFLRRSEEQWQALQNQQLPAAAETPNDDGDPDEAPPEFPEGYEDEVRDWADKLTEHYERKFQAFQKAQQAVQTFEQERQAAAIEEAHKAFDQGIEQLGPDFEPLFGKGNYRTIDRNSEGFQNRQKVWDTMAHLMQLGHDRETAFQKAVYAELGPRIAQHQKTTTRQELQTAVKNRQNLIQTPPSGRKQEVPKGTQAAVAAVAELARSKGMSLGDEDDFDDVLDGFL